MGSKFHGNEKHDSFILYIYIATGGLLWQVYYFVKLALDC
jgi:hypothetical protein